MSHPLPRVIAHLDMDAFYASVELLRYPMIRGLAAVVGGGRRHTPVMQEDGTLRFAKLEDYVGRGVVTTSTYEARAFGVFSGLGMMKAAALAPHAILLPMDFDSYRLYSRKFKAAVAELAPVIEDRGIDEIYIDLTDVPGIRDTIGHDPLGGVRAFAQELKNNVHRATGLTCSVGVTPNKLLSKIASELNKPNGLTVLTAEDIPSRIWPLPVRRINGIGPKAGARLDALDIHTIGELAARDMAWLTQHFTVNTAQWLHDVSRGIDDRPVVTSSEPVSMSRETTFDRDLHAKRDRAELGAVFTQPLHPGGRRPVAQGLRRPHHRHQAALRRLQDGDARPVDHDPHRRPRRDPPARGAVPQARGPHAAAAAAGRARGRAVAPGRAGGGGGARCKEVGRPGERGQAEGRRRGAAGRADVVLGNSLPGTAATAATRLS